MQSHLPAAVLTKQSVFEQLEQEIDPYTQIICLFHLRTLSPNI